MFWIWKQIGPWFSLGTSPPKTKSEYPGVGHLFLSKTRFSETTHFLKSTQTAMESPKVTYVTAAGLRASNSRNTSVWPELIQLGTRRVVTATRSVTVMEYYFYLRAGTRTSHTERWRALSSRYSLLLGCWPFGFPITLTLKTGVRHRSHFYRDTAIPVRYGAERNKVVYFLRISKVPGVGPGENYMGRQVTATTDGNWLPRIWAGDCI